MARVSSAVLWVDIKDNVPAGGTDADYKVPFSCMFGRTRRIPPLSSGSVRISSKATSNSGLFVADIERFSSGPSARPAFWSEHPKICAQGILYQSVVPSAAGYCFDPRDRPLIRC